MGELQTFLLDHFARRCSGTLERDLNLTQGPAEGPGNAGAGQLRIVGVGANVASDRRFHLRQPVGFGWVIADDVHAQQVDKPLGHRVELTSGEDIALGNQTGGKIGDHSSETRSEIEETAGWRDAVEAVIDLAPGAERTPSASGIRLAPFAVDG